MKFTSQHITDFFEMYDDYVMARAECKKVMYPAMDELFIHEISKHFYSAYHGAIEFICGACGSPADRKIKSHCKPCMEWIKMKDPTFKAEVIGSRIWFDCPNCKKRHSHGLSSDLSEKQGRTHRASHCKSMDGYYLEWGNKK